MSEKEFTLKYEFQNVGKLEHGQGFVSPKEEHFGLNWCMGIQKWGDVLRMYFFAYGLYGNQKIYVDYTKKIFSRYKEHTHSISGSNPLKYNYWPCPLIDWGNLKSDFLNDGKLDAEIHLKITEMVGFPGFPMVPMKKKVAPLPRKELRSFGEEMKQFSDVVLKVEDRKFYVSKLTLSSQSLYFANLFLGQSEKSEIELKDVNPDDFQYYLEVIYAEDAINDDTVVRILQIADVHQTPLAIKKCEKYLIKESKMELKRKLELAGKYKLEELKKMCLDQIKSNKKRTFSSLFKKLLTK
ncbi:hypothetical protein B9Z55_007806 [Caenorhabditis nigoni]|uniref:BTB domain-containing protein n=1 Tax=Caenorhabditis nigoni TaxID=1611254 RepID=A0A2G5VBN5_9PELO|nr:hypothetical protein B9Z55_007806 [Caenorhabditis nigoni]